MRDLNARGTCFEMTRCPYPLSNYPKYGPSKDAIFVPSQRAHEQGEQQYWQFADFSIPCKIHHASIDPISPIPLDLVKYSRLLDRTKFAS